MKGTGEREKEWEEIECDNDLEIMNKISEYMEELREGDKYMEEYMEELREEGKD